MASVIGTQRSTIQPGGAAPTAPGVVGDAAPVGVDAGPASPAGAVLAGSPASGTPTSLPGTYPDGLRRPAPPQGRLARLFNTLYTRPAWLAPLALLACFGMTVVYVEKFNPTTGEIGPTGGCLFRALTGLDCPGCGGTRAFWYLLHGNLPEAARNHAVAVFAAPFLVYMYIAWSVNRIFHARLPMLKVSPLAVGLFMGGWLVFAVLRNLPWAPFTSLYV